MDDMETQREIGTEALTVGQVAERYGVTVRALHHYDAVGLLEPSGRTSAGYRLYEPGDLQRLQHVVVYRRLGFGLDEVAELLSGDADVAAHLRRQRESVMERLEELTGLVEALDRAWEREMSNRPATDAEIREIFGAADQPFDDRYAEEAEERWGDTEAWAQSQERSAAMTPEQWREVKESSDRLDADMAAAVRDGVAPTDERAMQLAERHRLSVETFYDCSPDFHRNLGELFVADERFRDRLEGLAPGLATWLREAINANADRS